MADSGGPPDLEAQAPKRPPPNHPIALFFHVGFKASAIVAYVFLYLFTKSFVSTFLAVILLSAADFWATKNVTGRLLVGLRWWHQVREDGTEEWQFESLEDKTTLNDREVLIFWASLIGALVLWCFTAFLLIFRPTEWPWFSVVIVAILMLGSNLVGYWKCAKESKARLESYAQNQASGYVTSTLMNYAMGGGGKK